jgi:uncharacterized delta-60 repeat protein
MLVLLAGLLCGTKAFAVGGTVYAWGYDAFGALNVPAGLTTAVEVAAGNYFSMALKADGTVLTWGDNAFGLLNIPPQATNVMAISTRGYDCLVLRGDGSLVQWGNGQTNILLAPTGVVAIAGGGSHYLALREDGELVAWGANNYGQCNIPLEATNVVAIGAGYTHSLALRKDGRVLAWGENSGGSTDIPPQATNVVAISCGPSFNLALRADRTVVAWGLDWGGNLPVPESATNVVAISAGEMPDFAIRTDGSVVAWGRSDNGETNVPAGLSPAFAIGAGNLHSLGIRVVGGVTLLRQPVDRVVSAGDSVFFNVPAIGRVPVSYQWRFNGLPMPGETSAVLLLPGVQATNVGTYDLLVQNGSSSATSRAATLSVLPAAPTITRHPTNCAVALGGSATFAAWAKGTLPLRCQWQWNGADLPGETNAVLSLSNLTSANNGLYRLVVTNDLGQATSAEASLEVGLVYVWGTNQYHVLELPLGLTNVVAIAAGETHALAVKPDGTIIGWGDNGYDQTTSWPDITNVTAIAAGNQFSLALRGDGTVRPWGNTYEAPADATNIAAIAAGYAYNLVLKSNGTPYVWGFNNPPTPPASATNLVAIAAGRYHSLGLRVDGTVMGWGSSFYGQATPPASATNILAVAAGGFFSLGLREDGTLLPWGTYPSPVPSEATNIVAIAAGGSHALALRDDGRVIAWGDASLGVSDVPPALAFPSAIAAGGIFNLALLDRGTLRFVREPASRAVLAGNATALSGWAIGPDALSYQWLRNGTNLPGATHAYLTFPDLRQVAGGSYALVAISSQGSITSQVAVLTVIPSPPVILQQPASQMPALGGSATFSVTAKGTEPMTYQWRHDGVNLAGATSTALTLTNVQWLDTGFYDVVLSNSAGTVVSREATLTFTPTVDSFDLGANSAVYALAPQPDGKVLLGGAFTSLDSQVRSNLARLNVDGTLDAAFNPPVGGSSSLVYALAVQPDRRILVGGRFTTLCGQSRTNLARLKPDGSLDASFDPRARGSHVYCIALQPDGKILVGGTFTNLLGLPRTNLARLNPDGTLDAPFNPGANGNVYSLAVQPDGNILVGGAFTTLGGQARSRIGRLDAGGICDTNFNPGTPGTIYSLLLQPDGRILVGGGFSTLAGQPRNCIARLEPDGTLDPAFNPGASTIVYSLALQADGKILAAGSFTTLGGQSRSYIGRLNANGTSDPTFNPGANNVVYGLAVQPDGRVLAGGNFTTFGGQTRTRVARIANPDPVSQSLLFTGTNITWLRGGASPEIWHVAFEISTNRTDWLSLGAGTYVSGGWQLTGLSTPPEATIRARGCVTAGYQNGSAWFVEDGTGPLAISIQPASQTNLFGSNATFSVLAAGTPPFTCQWLKDGAALDNGANIYGAHTPTLTVLAVAGADRGGYSVVISNSSGSITSAVAALWVVEPLITLQPVSQVTNAGQTVVFRADAIGTPPLNYQWRKSGVALADATRTSLSITNVQWADAGLYEMTVTNIFGSATTTGAVLALPSATDSFNPGASGGWGSYPGVYALAVQGDEKVVVAGNFTRLGGQTRSYVGRLNADGTLDTTFNPAGDSWTFALAIQADGKILVGGWSRYLGGQARNYLGRLNSDGSLDQAFNAALVGLGGDLAGVYALALQPDGKMIAAGGLASAGGRACTNIVRLNPDGTPDPTFSASANDLVYSLALQPDGRVLLGGAFTSVCGQTRNRIARLNPDGSLDPAFNPGANDIPLALVVQPDGRILVGGPFTSLGGQPRSRLARLNADGTLDTTFNASANSIVRCLALQTDGGILVGGEFTTLNLQTRSRIGRLNPDGTLDPSFNPGASSTVYGLTIQPDGKILAGGVFSTLGGQSRAEIGRLSNTYPSVQGLALEGTTLTWLRSGTSPEVWRVEFDACTNGANWCSLGAGMRVVGGWQATNVVVPNGATVRARGAVASGRYNASLWFTDASIGPPAISIPPASRTNLALTLARFSVLAAGTPPLGYQWRKDGVALNEGGNVFGPSTTSLLLSNVSGADAGGYSVVVTNPLGSVTSQVAMFSVPDPFITSQPPSRTKDAGQTTVFSVTVVGTPPLSYQWRKNAAALVGATAASLTLTNVQSSQAGGYDVVVGNTFGSVTSSVAVLTVTPPKIMVADGAMGFCTNQFGFNVNAAVGQAVVIEASTNLLQWTAIQTNVVTSSGVIFFTDPESAGFPRRFYRARYHEGPLPLPAIGTTDGDLGFQTNQFGFSLTGVPGQTVVIQASTNLAAWTPLATNVLGTGPLYFSDPGSTDSPQRFYRAVVVP